MLYKPAKERLWDTWIVPSNGIFHLFYIRVSEGGSRWDGISLAISNDMLHWVEKGTVLVKHPDAIWLGTGMIQKVGTKFIMNFSEERPANHQVICFAESRDLINWTRLEHELHPDPQFYITNRSATCDFLYRWDSIGILDALSSSEPPFGLPPVFVPTSELVKTVSEVSPEKWSSLNEKNSGSKSPNLLRGWQKRLVSGMLVRCADGSNCSHFSTD